MKTTRKIYQVIILALTALVSLAFGMPCAVEGRVGETKTLLETIRGGRHTGYASIVFQFSKKANFW